MESFTKIALKVFENNAYAARFWFCMFIFMVFVSIGSTLYAFHLGKLELPVLVMDEANTFHLAAAQDMREAQALQNYLGSLAAAALLNRNPEGPDNPTLYKQLFAREALIYANKVIDEESDDFKKRNIHQKVEPAHIKQLNASFDTILMEVDGDIIRYETSSTQKLIDGKPFKLHLLFTRNGNFGQNKRLPYVCTNMKYVIIDDNKNQGQNATN